MGGSPSAALPAAESPVTIIAAQNAVVTPSVSSSSLAPYRNSTVSVTKPLGTGFLTMLKPTTVMGGY
jgi:hypothetical protein